MQAGLLVFGCPGTPRATKLKENGVYLNQLTIIGFTGVDADVDFTSNGTLITTLSMATKESWKNTDSEWQSRTEWHRVALFGKLARHGHTL